MLTQEEAQNLYYDIRDEHKKCMKDILNHAKLALDDKKFEHFKKIVFNNFGRSGLEKSSEDIIDKYTEQIKE